MIQKRILCFFVLLVFFYPLGAVAGTGQPQAACKDLAEQLGEKLDLNGLTLQLHSSNLLEQTSGRELAFSGVLAEALAATLSSHGAMVSIREQGEIPLRLLGDYELRDDQVNITVRIREMGKTSSSDLVVAQVTIDREDLEEDWFRSDLAALAEGLIKEIEKNLPGFDDPLVTVEQPRPGIKGQPTLQFGTALSRYLELAVSRSEMLGASSIGVRRTEYRLQSSYSRLSGSMRVEVRLLGPDNRSVALAQADIAEKLIPAELFALRDDRELSVCIHYTQRDRRDVKEGSVAAVSLMDGVSGSLARYGIQSATCDATTSQGLRVNTSLRLTEKKTRDGYGLMRGDLTLTIRNGNGKVIAKLTGKEKVPFSGSNDSAVEKLIEKMFDDAFQEELAARVLSK